MNDIKIIIAKQKEINDLSQLYLNALIEVDKMRDNNNLLKLKLDSAVDAKNDAEAELITSNNNNNPLENNDKFVWVYKTDDGDTVHYFKTEMAADDWWEGQRCDAVEEVWDLDGAIEKVAIFDKEGFDNGSKVNYNYNCIGCKRPSKGYPDDGVIDCSHADMGCTENLYGRWTCEGCYGKKIIKK